MEISEFKESETKELIDLWERCGLTAPQNNPLKDIKRKLKVNPELFLVGKINGKIVATIMGGYEGHRGWINYLGVDPDFRKKGYGKILINEIEKRLKLMGCPKINLQVRETNSEIIAFYRSAGYLIDSVISLGKRIEED